MKKRNLAMAAIVLGLVASAAYAAKYEKLTVGTLSVSTAITAGGSGDGGFHLTDARGITLRRDEPVNAHYLGNGFTNTPTTYRTFDVNPGGMWQEVVPDRTGQVTNMFLGIYQEPGSVDEVFIINVLVTDSANRVRGFDAFSYDTQAGHGDGVLVWFEVAIDDSFGVISGETLKVTLTHGPLVTGSSFWDHIGWAYTTTSGYEPSNIGTNTSFLVYFDTFYTPETSVALSVTTVSGTEGTTDDPQLNIDSPTTITGDVDITGVATITGDVGITGDLDITGDVDITGGATISEDATAGAQVVSYRVLTNSSLQNVVEDTTPQLGGNLDAQAKRITEVSNLVFDNHASPATPDFPYIGVADDGSTTARNLLIAASPTLSISATNSSYVAVSAKDDLSFSGNLWLGVQSGDEIQFHTDNSLTPTTTFDGSTWDVKGSALTNALLDAGGLTYGAVPLARLADIDEANLDTSVNASLDLADSALQEAQGAAVASADELILGTDGNFFSVTGTTTINHIRSTGWSAGDVVRLQTAAGITFTDAAGTPSGAEADVKTAGGADAVMDANDIITFIYDGTVWWETSRIAHP